MTGPKRNSATNIVNWIARILGLIVVVVFVTFLIGDTVDTIQQGYEFDAESLFIILPIVAAMVGYIMSWRHKIIGGSLLILVSITFGILVSVVAQNHLGPTSDFRALAGWLILGLPFLIVGALFLLTAYLDRKTSS